MGNLGRVTRIIQRNNLKTKIERLQRQNLMLNLRHRAFMRAIVKQVPAADLVRTGVVTAAFHLSYEVTP